MLDLVADVIDVISTDAAADLKNIILLKKLSTINWLLYLFYGNVPITQI